MAKITSCLHRHATFMVGARQSLPWLMLGIWLAALTLITYEPAMQFSYSYTDDSILVKDKLAFLADASNIGKVFVMPFGQGEKDDAPYYRPLVTLSFMMDAHFNGAAPEAYHITNVVLHGAVVLVFSYLLFLLGLPFWSAALGSTWFAVHPALTHAIAWIPGRVDIILTLMLMGAVINFILYMQQRRLISLLLHLTFLLLAMFSKESAIGLIAILGAVLWYKHRSRFVGRERSLWWGWAAISAVWVALWVHVEWGAIITTVHSDNNPMAYLFPILSINLGKILLPHHYAVLAYYPDTHLWQAVAAIPLIAYGATLLRHEDRPLALVCVMFFVVYSILTLPAAQFQILENRMYELVPACIILLLLVLKGISWRFAAHGPLLSGVVFVLLTLFYLERVFDYLPAFTDREHFTAQAIATSPHHVIANLNRGSYLADRGRLDEAEQFFLAAMKISPDYPYLRNNLGYIKEKKGDFGLAEQLYRDELRGNATYIGTYINLGNMLLRQGRRDEALSTITAGLDRDPENQILLKMAKRIKREAP